MIKSVYIQISFVSTLLSVGLLIFGIVSHNNLAYGLFLLLNIFSGIVFYLFFNRSIENKKRIDDGMETSSKAQLIIDGTKRDLLKLIERIDYDQSATGILQKFISDMPGLITISQAAGYRKSNNSDEYTAFFQFGYLHDEPLQPFSIGDGLNGQTVKDGTTRIVQNVRLSDFSIATEAATQNNEKGSLVLIPSRNDNNVVALIELLSSDHLDYGLLEVFDKFGQLITKSIEREKV